MNFSLFSSSSLNKNFALKLLQNNFRPKHTRERFCLSSLLKSRLSLPPPPLSPPFLLFSSKTSCAFKRKNQLRMSSSGLGGGKKVRMKRRSPWNWIGFISSLNGVDLRQNVVYISPFLSLYCSYHHRAIPPIEVLLFSSSDHHHLLFFLNSSFRYPHHIYIEKRHPSWKRKRSLRLFQRIGRRKFYQQH